MLSHAGGWFSLEHVGTAVPPAPSLTRDSCTCGWAQTNHVYVLRNEVLRWDGTTAQVPLAIFFPCMAGGACRVTVYFEFPNARGAIQGSEAGASKGLDSQASLVAVLFVASAAQAAFLVRGLP